MISDVRKSCIHNILTDRLVYAKVCAKWIPEMLTEDNKRQRVEVNRKYLQAYETDGQEFTDFIITEDET